MQFRKFVYHMNWYLVFVAGKFNLNVTFVQHRFVRTKRNDLDKVCYVLKFKIYTLSKLNTQIYAQKKCNRYLVKISSQDIDTRLMKTWTAIDRLSIIWKSDLTDKMKRSFFQAAVVSILLYGCTTWTLTKRLEKRLDGNYTRMLRAILNKSWRQHPTKHQLYGHLHPITKTIQVRRTRYAGHCS